MGGWKADLDGSLALPGRFWCLDADQGADSGSVIMVSETNIFCVDPGKVVGTC